MITLIISCILILYGWNRYTNKNQANALVVLVFFLTNYFQLKLLVDESLIKSYDLYLIYLAGLLFLEYRKSNLLFSTKNDKIAKVILWIEIWFFLVFIGTIVLGEEDFSFAIKVYRLQLFFFSYFIFRRIPYCIFVNAAKKIGTIGLLLGGLFLLQIFGVELLAGNSDELLFSGDIKRYRNIPYLTILFLIFAFTADIKAKQRYLFIIFWGAILVLSQHRGMMMALGMSFIMIIIYRRKIGKIFKIAIPLVLVGLMLAPVLVYRFSENSQGVSIMEDMEKGFTIKDVDSTESEGTFMFRMILILERIEYMADRPNKLFCGNGTIHEDSKKTQTKFNFRIGSGKADANGKDIVKQQIDTNDVALISMFMRYGLVFIILFVILCVNLFRVYNSTHNELSLVSSIFLMYCILRIFSGDEFSPVNYSLLFAFASQIKYSKI